MNVKLVILGALALVVAPLAYAHTDGGNAGTPKNYCEDPNEWHVHDYGPPATGTFIALQQDGNIIGNCSEATVVDPGVPCLGVDPNDPINSFFVGLCDAEIDPPLADFDGHSEFAFGGAWLLVRSGDGTGADGGTVFCFGEPGHHVNLGPFAVDDNVLGAGASFSVYADTADITMTGNPCGDFESDFGTDCVGFCTVTFPPGLDGSYQVYVQGTAGHIRDGTNDPPECSDGINNDGDAGTDWPHDDGCDSSLDDDENGNGIRTALLPFLPECTNLFVDDEGDGEADFFNPFTGGDPDCANALTDPEP